MPVKPAPPEERFWRLVEKADGCWLWSGARNAKGYGVFQRGRSQGSILAHRFVVGAPKGSSVMHRCDVPACVNPAHLAVGSHADNMADMVAKGRARKARGERAGKAKLTESDVREIRRLAQAGIKNPAIGRQFGVHAASIWSIVHRLHWAHVSDAEIGNAATEKAF